MKYIIAVLAIMVAIWGGIFAAKVISTVPTQVSLSEPVVKDNIQIPFSEGNKEITVTTDSSNTNASSKVKEFTVSVKNFSFTPNIIMVKKGDKIKINFKNENGFHNLFIDELKVATKTIKEGATDTVEFTADKVGTFQYYCSIGSHRANGMWGTLKVTE